MNHTITYPPKFPRPAMGGYRYCFNGQEADSEALGEGALHAFEYRLIIFFIATLIYLIQGG